MFNLLYYSNNVRQFLPQIYRRIHKINTNIPKSWSINPKDKQINCIHKAHNSQPKTHAFLHPRSFTFDVPMWAEFDWTQTRWKYIPILYEPCRIALGGQINWKSMTVYFEQKTGIAMRWIRLGWFHVTHTLEFN